MENQSNQTSFGAVVERPKPMRTSVKPWSGALCCVHVSSIRSAPSFCMVSSKVTSDHVVLMVEVHTKASLCPQPVFTVQPVLSSSAVHNRAPALAQCASAPTKSVTVSTQVPVTSLVAVQTAQPPCYGPFQPTLVTSEQQRTACLSRSEAHRSGSEHPRSSPARAWSPHLRRAQSMTLPPGDTPAGGFSMSTASSAQIFSLCGL